MYTVLGKVALITGGSMGIGAAIAKEFLQSGLKGVTIADINEELGLILVEGLNKEFGEGKAIFTKTDVSDRNQFDDALRRTVEVFNNLDIVVNNAVAGAGAERNWERGIGVNLIGTINGTILSYEHYLETYRSGNEAVIINISSVAGLYPCDPFPIYAAAKSGIIGLTRTLGSDAHYRRTKIKVIAICPGRTNTKNMNVTIDQVLGPAYLDLYNLLKDAAPVEVQSPSTVSKAVVNIIKNGNSGSVWVVENNQDPFQVKFLSKDESKF